MITSVLAAILSGPLAAMDEPVSAARTKALSVPTSASTQELDQANPVRPIPETPLGHDQKLADLSNRPEPEKARLGRWLFFDPRLSPGSTNSCEKCHVVEAAWSDTTTILPMNVLGHKVLRRTMTFVNTAFSFYPEQFWDGRAPNLEEQPKGPRLNVEAIRATAAYGPFFQRSFGDTQVTTDRVAIALAHYQRTFVSGNSPWDRWRRKGDEKAVSEEVKLGDKLFFGKGRCAHCHVATVLTDPKFDKVRELMKQGPLHLVGNSFTDWRFHNTGIGYNPEKKEFADLGRAIVTNRKEDRGAFKTPPLREVALRAPYMHDGSIETLEAVIEHYRKGGVDNPYLDPLMEPLDLTDAEAKALVEFLKSLTGEGYHDTAPGLYPR